MNTKLPLLALTLGLSGALGAQNLEIKGFASKNREAA